MNLLIFLDLTYNPGKNFKFYSLQGQNFKIFLIFTYNQGKAFLILPITRGGGGGGGEYVYLVSIGSRPPRRIQFSIVGDTVPNQVRTLSQVGTKKISKGG